VSWSEQDAFEGEDDPLEAEEETPEQQQAASVAELQKQLNQQKAAAGRMRAAIQRHGLGVDDGGNVLVQNRALADGLLQAQGGPVQQQAATPEEDEPEEMPDPTLDPEGFAGWLNKRDEKLASRTAASFQAQMSEQMAGLRGPLQGIQMEKAIQAAEAVLPAKGLGFLLEREDFDTLFKQALVNGNIPEANWTNPAMVTMVAGAILAQLPDDEEPPAPRPRRAPSAAEQRAAASAIARDSHRATGASRGGGRPADTTATDWEQRAAQSLGVTVEQYRALGDPTGNEYFRQVKADKARAARGAN
jgi:hypothetical protein